MSKKVVVTTRIPLPLVVLFKSACKEKRIRLETFFEQRVIAGLEKLGYEVPPSLVDQQEIEVPGPVKGPLMRA